MFCEGVTEKCIINLAILAPPVDKVVPLTSVYRSAVTSQRKDTNMVVIIIGLIYFF